MATAETEKLRAEIRTLSSEIRKIKGLSDEEFFRRVEQSPRIQKLSRQVTEAEKTGKGNRQKLDSMDKQIKTDRDKLNKQLNGLLKETKATTKRVTNTETGLQRTNADLKKSASAAKAAVEKTERIARDNSLLQRSVQQLQAVNKQIKDSLYSLSRGIVAVEKRVASVAAKVAEASSNALEAIGISKSAQSWIAKHGGRVLGFLAKIAPILDVINLAGQVASLKLTEARLDALEKRLDARLGEGKNEFSYLQILKGRIDKINARLDAMDANNPNVQEARKLANDALYAATKANEKLSNLTPIALRNEAIALNAERKANESLAKSIATAVAMTAASAAIGSLSVKMGEAIHRAAGAATTAKNAETIATQASTIKCQLLFGATTITVAGQF